MSAENKLDRVGSRASLLGVIVFSLSVAMVGQAPTPAKWKPPTTQGLTLVTRAFDDGGIIPNKYTQASTTPRLTTRRPTSRPRATVASPRTAAPARSAASRYE